MIKALPDSIILVVISVLFFISHQIYCQNDMSMRVYLFLEAIHPTFWRDACYQGLDVRSVRNWLPDSLWAYMLTMVMGRLWLDKLKSKFFLPIMLIMVSGYEVLQGIEIASGTFDVLDLVVSWSGCLLAYTTLRWLERFYE